MFKPLSTQSFILFFLFLALACKKPITASKPEASKQKVTREDYQRAESFYRKNLRKKVFHLSVQPHWLPESTGFWYQTNTREGEQFYLVTSATAQKQLAFDHARLADTLSHVLGKNIPKEELPVRNLDWKDAKTITFSVANRTYATDLGTYRTVLQEEPQPPTAEEVALSPDSTWAAFNKKHNLLIRPNKGGKTIALTTDGHIDYAYAEYHAWDDMMIGEGGQRPSHFTAQWSPNSKKILTQILDLRNAGKMHLLDWSVDSLYRPRVLAYYRGSPGDTNIMHMIPVVFDVATRRMTRVDLPPLPYFMDNNLTWSADGSYLYGLHHHRGFKQHDVIKADPTTGKVTVLYSIKNDTFVEDTQFRLFEKQGLAIITSEQTGWNQLYRLDWKTGAAQPITQGEFVVKRILELDEEQKLIYFTAAGKEKGANPYFDFLYKVHLDGSGLQLLSPEMANHDVSLSPDKKCFVDNYSTITQPTQSVLRSLADGSLLMKIDSADVKDLLATGWQFPQPFEALARDGKTILYGALWKPSNFDPTKKYPLIDDSYTGPQATVYPNAFSDGLSVWNQSLAEMGFVVMAVDGLGTAGRSKAFHNWSYKRLGYGLTDHVLAIQQLGERHPWLDTTKVGIFGHSAGGYDAAHALMQFPNCYKVAVSQSADHDHRMEKDWWPEMYMGWPVDSAYHLQSNVTMASKLKGNLLLIHGGLDENVNPSATFKLSEALIKAGKNFDLLIIPSAHHGYPEAYSRYVDHKRWNHFIRYLKNQTPLEGLD